MAADEVTTPNEKNVPAPSLLVTSSEGGAGGAGAGVVDDSSVTATTVLVNNLNRKYPIRFQWTERNNRVGERVAVGLDNSSKPAGEHLVNAGLLVD